MKALGFLCWLTAVSFVFLTGCQNAAAPVSAQTALYENGTYQGDVVIGSIRVESGEEENTFRLWLSMEKANGQVLNLLPYYSVDLLEAPTRLTVKGNFVDVDEAECFVEEGIPIFFLRGEDGYYTLYFQFGDLCVFSVDETAGLLGITVSRIEEAEGYTVVSDQPEGQMRPLYDGGILRYGTGLAFQTVQEAESFLEAYDGEAYVVEFSGNQIDRIKEQER